MEFSNYNNGKASLLTSRIGYERLVFYTILHYDYFLHCSESKHSHAAYNAANAASLYINTRIVLVFFWAIRLIRIVNPGLLRFQSKRMRNAVSA